MFKAAVLSSVLTLVVAPNAALLCEAWCHPQVAAAIACHHEKPSAAWNAVGDDTCDDCDNALGAAQFLREDVRRSVSALDAAYAIVVPRYQFAYSTIDARPGHEPGREWSLEQRPLPTALRI